MARQRYKLGRVKMESLGDQEHERKGVWTDVLGSRGCDRDSFAVNQILHFMLERLTIVSVMSWCINVEFTVQIRSILFSWFAGYGLRLGPCDEVGIR